MDKLAIESDVDDLRGVDQLKDDLRNMAKRSGISDVKLLAEVSALPAEFKVYDVTVSDRVCLQRRRLLVVSPVAQNATRADARTAAIRNRYILEHSEMVVFAAIDPNGSLSRLIGEYPNLQCQVSAIDFAVAQDGNFYIKGGAGTGKSDVLVHIAPIAAKCRRQITRAL